ncbi:COMM domain-containing protein 4 [Dendroctonus ponderosae]|uniref:COMM domain-containing protein n=1 Tax=Dendroctonus ponderosae TaxID=77166 RepID=A0AAR5PX97_DENPD|nr:COMM domain-containing protein 4 [Dendroctonus ponderosae]KAH1023530.1 hypothetical protein HUJ04_012717 [Dendroctonus ponderosae]KAH1029980.1 hypothetical protein HUJ05_003123 [Dendroctonus ponderosae]
MKFRFNGDADCPDWILSEIYTLSRLSSVKLKLLGQIVCQGIISPPIQVEKVEKLFADSKLDADIDLKSCIACVSYLLSSATRFNCDNNSLQSELQQLGLPREHSVALKRVFDQYIESLSASFRQKSLKVKPLESAAAVTDSQHQYVTLQLEIDGGINKSAIFPLSKVDDLLKELEQIKKVMIELKEAL